MPSRLTQVFVIAAAVTTLSSCGSESFVLGPDASTDGSTATPSAPACVVPTPVEPPPRTLSDFSLEERQAITNQELIHDHIDPVVHPYREAGDNGYAQVRVNIKAVSAEIRWKGEPPADVRGLVGTSPNCVRVELLEVPYSRADVDRAYRTVIRAKKDGQVPRFSGLQPSKAFDTLEVGFTSAEFDAKSSDANRVKFEAAAGMPVRFIVVEGTDVGSARVPEDDA